MGGTGRGVPQGSILGLLLYLVFTNELSEVTKDQNCTDESHQDHSKIFGNNCRKCGTVVLFADDVTYHIASKTRQRNQNKIVENLDKLQKILNDNKLALNIGKTKF